MKRYVVVLVLAGMVFSCMAQHGNDTSRRVVVRPLVEIIAGAHGTFYGSTSMQKDLIHPKCPISAGVLAGASFSDFHGWLNVKTGFVVNNAGFKYDPVMDYTAVVASVPLIIGYDFHINRSFSVFVEAGAAYSRFLKYSRKVVNAKPYTPVLEDMWKSYFGIQVCGSVGFNYWFHPRFALNVSPYFMCCATMYPQRDEAEDFMRPILGCKVGVLFR